MICKKTQIEEVYIASDRNHIDARFPVQYVIRPQNEEHHDYRGYAGMITGGVFKPGDEVVVLPSGFTSTVRWCSFRRGVGKPSPS